MSGGGLFRLFGRHLRARDELIFAAERDAAHALGRATDDADALRRRANDLTVSRDHHDFIVVGHRYEVDDLAVPIGGPDIDHSEATAALDAVLSPTHIIAKNEAAAR